MKSLEEGLCRKTKENFCNAIRDASCSRGWLRAVVHCLFGGLIFCSFIIILVSTLKSSSTKSNEPEPPLDVKHCITNKCKVKCDHVPFFGMNTEDAIKAIWTLDPQCYDDVELELHNSEFYNKTMDLKWLHQSPYRIKALDIFGGNTNSISSHVFNYDATENLEKLSLNAIVILKFDPNIFTGLKYLKHLVVKDCLIKEFNRYTLQHISASLLTLYIKASWFWNPRYVTGILGVDLPNVIEVDFAGNYFGTILNNRSFTEISSCRALILKASQISSISPGTFDHLKSIRYINLSKNHLFTIPWDLFEPIQNPYLTVNLDNNHWFCDCNDCQWTSLYRQGFIDKDPHCYYPTSMSGVHFSAIETKCESNKTMPMYNKDIGNYTNTRNFGIYVNNDCQLTNSKTAVIMSIDTFNECPNSFVVSFQEDVNRAFSEFDNNYLTTNNTWIVPTILERNHHYSIVELVTTDMSDYGLLWAKSACPGVINCIRNIPSVLRLFNVGWHESLKFCPFSLKTGGVETGKCVTLSFSIENGTTTSQSFLLFILVALLSFLLGGTIVYLIILMKPALLKCNTRILFVKHKTVDALVLPREVLMKNVRENQGLTRKFKESIRKIFVFSEHRKNMQLHGFERSNSVRSDISYSPSYVSALQPTEDQLVEWRLRYHSNDKITVSSITSSTYTIDGNCL